jgi:hypothetical protein
MIPARVLVLAACVVVAAGGRVAAQDTPGPPAQVPSSACPVATDHQYAFTKEHPVQVGGGPMFGAARQRRYLDALRGPGGQHVTYKLGGVIEGPDGTLIDPYELTYDGLERPVTIYLDWYHYNPQRAPQGFICGQPFNLGPPPVSPMQEMDDLRKVAVTQGATRDFDPIPLDADGGTTHGVMFDQFRMLARAARVAAAAGQKLDPDHLPRDVAELHTIVVAYPLTCEGRVVQVITIDFVAQNGTMMSRANLPPQTANVARLLPGVHVPEGSLAATFPLIRPRTTDSIAVTYAEPCGATGNSVTLPIRFSQPRAVDTPMPALPPGAAGDQPVILQALIDTDGTMQQITYVGGPGDLVAAATEAVRRWRSEPGRINGAPIPMGAMLQVRFTAGTPKVER